MSTEHSKDFYALSADEKLNALYEINVRTSNDMLEVRRLVDPELGARRAARRAALTAAAGLLGGALTQIAFLALLAVSCR